MPDITCFLLKFIQKYLPCRRKYIYRPCKRWTEIWTRLWAYPCKTQEQKNVHVCSSWGSYIAFTFLVCLNICSVCTTSCQMFAFILHFQLISTSNSAVSSEWLETHHVISFLLITAAVKFCVLIARDFGFRFTQLIKYEDIRTLFSQCPFDWLFLC